MAAKGSVIARILSEYDAKGTKAARKDLAELQKNFHEFGKKATEAFALAGAAVVGLATKMAVDGVKAAMAEGQQFAVLANTLKNTTGANDAAIESVDRYIKQAALRYNFQESQLIPSLQSLAIATKNITQAETLQHLAMDISANKGKDLNEVSLALSKAYLGNFNALKRMGVPLSESVIKSKDFSAAVKELNKAFSGSAATAADTFAGRVGRIGIAFDMVKKTIGNAIIVALQPFLDKFMTALPQIEKWLNSNADKIAAFFITGISYGVGFLKTLYDIFNFVAQNITIFAEMGAIIVAAWAGAKAAAAAGFIVKTIETLVKVYGTLTKAAKGAAFWEAIATGGLESLVGAVVGGGAFIAMNVAFNKFIGNTEKTSKGVGKLTFDFKGLTSTIATTIKGLGQITNTTNTTTTATTALEKQQKAVLENLKQMGIIPRTETDPIELEAAKLNVIKQNQGAQAAVNQSILDQLESQMSVNEAAQRYADILNVLADHKLDPSEIEMLATKWGMSKDKVVAYIAQITGDVSIATSLYSGGNLAADAWKNALDALNAYLKLLGGGIQSPSAPSGGGGGTPPYVPGEANPATPTIDTIMGGPKDLSNYVTSGVSSFGATISTTSINSTNGADRNGVGGSPVYVTVMGSVVTQQDLTAAVKAGLQQDQLSGKNLTVNALAL